uniref:Mutant patatin-like phospholipase domain containing 2 n=1 Tax=Homo sapiens TaxID=9606 RepID=A0A142EFS1_HUMAN|nr:mutant patatin-like phospholipase domain containing 2 [Homo sapiens]
MFPREKTWNISFAASSASTTSAWPPASASTRPSWWPTPRTSTAPRPGRSRPRRWSPGSAWVRLVPSSLRYLKRPGSGSWAPCTPPSTW